MSNAPSNYALTVLADAEIRTVVTVSKLQAVAIDQLAAIPRIEREAALRAILCGLTLLRIKASLPHGQWEPWVRQVRGQTATSGSVLPGVAQVRFYMRLAIAAIECTKATVPEIVSLPGNQTELALEPADESARRLMTKLVDFVGRSSLNELLSEHGIKDRKASKNSPGKKAQTEAEMEMTLNEHFNQIEEHLRVATEGTLDRATWMSFTRRQHDDLRFIFEKAAEEVKQRFLKTHPQKKEEA